MINNNQWIQLWSDELHKSEGLGKIMQVTDWTPSQFTNMEIITVESLYGGNNEDGQFNW